MLKLHIFMFIFMSYSVRKLSGLTGAHFPVKNPIEQSIIADLDGLSHSDFLYPSDYDREPCEEDCILAICITGKLPCIPEHEPISCRIDMIVRNTLKGFGGSPLPFFRKNRKNLVAMSFRMKSSSTALLCTFKIIEKINDINQVISPVRLSLVPRIAVISFPVQRLSSSPESGLEEKAYRAISITESCTENTVITTAQVRDRSGEDFIYKSFAEGSYSDRLFVVSGVRPRTNYYSAPPYKIPFTERSAEMTKLRTAMTGKNERPFVIIEGPTGSGKSRLIEELSRDLDNMKFVSVECIEKNEPLSCIRRFAGSLLCSIPFSTETEIQKAIESFQLRDVAQKLIPFMKLLVSNPDSRALTSLWDELSSAFMELLDAFLQKHQEHKYIFAFDDIHNADKASMEILSFLVENRRFIHPHGLALSFRECSEIPSGWMEEACVAVYTLPLSPNSAIASAMKMRGRGHLSNGQVKALAMMSGGNPFHLNELLSLFENPYFSQKRPFPSACRKAVPTVNLKAGLLESPQRRLLELCSFAGYEFSFDLIKNAAERHPETGDTFLHSLEILKRSGFILNMSDFPRMFRFYSNTTKEAIESSVLSCRKKGFIQVLSEARKELNLKKADSVLSNLQLSDLEEGEATMMLAAAEEKRLNYLNAIKYTERAADIFRRSGFLLREGRALSKTAEYHLLLNDFGRAFDAAVIAVEHSRDIRNIKLLPYCYWCSVRICRLIGIYRTAQDFLKGLASFQGARPQALFLLGSAQISCDMGAFAKALKWLNSCFSVLEKEMHEDIFADACLLASLVYALMKKKGASMQYAEIAKEYIRNDFRKEIYLHLAKAKALEEEDLKTACEEIKKAVVIYDLKGTFFIERDIDTLYSYWTICPKSDIEKGKEHLAKAYNLLTKRADCLTCTEHRDAFLNKNSLNKAVIADYRSVC